MAKKDLHKLDDPVLVSSRREALVALCVFLLALAYTVGYCTLYGYETPEEGVSLVLGIPAWVMWGVFVPWGICTVFHCCFSALFMQDHMLEEPAAPPDAQGVTGEESA